MSGMDYIVVMPSIRELPLEYLEPLGDTPVVVVDDSDGVAPRHDRRNITYVDYAFQDKYLPGAAEIIPRHNPSCKDFGLYYAYREGFDVAILLDDDCDTRVTPDFLYQVPVGKTVVASPFMSPSGWFNTMLLLGETELWARGYPYEHRAEACTILHQHPQLVEPKFNEGLWTGTPDINGIDKIRIGNEGVTAKREICGRAVLREGQHLPLSIMNVQLATELIPAFYQPPDYPVGGGFRIRRHDDVWSMYVLKALMDIKGDMATVGGPLIWHRKEGDMIKEALSEHCTNLIQPHLTAIVDKAAQSVESDTYGEMALQLGQYMGFLSYSLQGAFRTVVADYAQRICRWAEVCGA